MNAPTSLKLVFVVAICACFAVAIWGDSLPASTDYCQTIETTPCAITPYGCPDCGNYVWGNAAMNYSNPPTFLVPSSYNGGPYRHIGFESVPCFLEAGCVVRLTFVDRECNNQTGECDIISLGSKCYKLTPGEYSPALRTRYAWLKVDEKGTDSDK